MTTETGYVCEKEREKNMNNSWEGERNIWVMLWGGEVREEKKIWVTLTNFYSFRMH